MRYRFTQSMVSFVALAVACPTVALAQEADMPSAESSSEIIVQARRRDESVQDVPAVVNVVTADMLAQLNIRQFSDVSTIVPGLSLGISSSGIGGNASIRGVNFEVLTSGNNGTVEFYFNDASIQSGALIQSVYDVGQIEVLRGPQGTLRGRASPSGSITVTTKRPDLTEFGGYANLTATTLGGYNANGAVNLPLVRDVLALRVAALYDENESDQVRPATVKGKPFNRTESVRASLLAEPIDNLNIQATYQYLHTRGNKFEQVQSLSAFIPGSPASPRLIQPGDRLSIVEAPQRNEQTYDTVNWQASYGFGGQQLIYVGSYNHLKSDILQTAQAVGDAANLFPGIDFGQGTVTNATDWTHEVRLQSVERVANLVDYVVGGFYRKSTPPSDITSQTFLTAFGNPLPAATPNPVNTVIARRGRAIEKSVFGNLTLHLGERTEISGGGRYIHFDETKLLSIPALGATLQNVRPIDDAWVYSASIKHQFSPDFMIYASTGSSWRPQVDVAGNSDLQRTALESSFLTTAPETSKSYEVGFKSSFLDRKLSLNVSAYHQTFKNSPYRAPGSGVYFINTAANTATTPISLVQGVSAFNFVAAVPIEVNGVEAEIMFRPSPRFNLNANLSYSLGKIKNGLIPCNDLNADGVPDAATSAPTLTQLRAAVGANDIGACRVNFRSGFSSPFAASVQAEYRYPVNDTMEVYGRGLLNYAGNSQVEPSNPYDNVDSYGLVNLYAGLRAPDGSWELAAFVKNVTNTQRVLTRGSGPTVTTYREVVQAPAGSRVFNSTYAAITMNMPREFGLNLRVAFGSR